MSPFANAAARLPVSTLVCAVFSCLASQAAAQQLYKCVQPNGRVSYQEEKCADNSKQSTVRAPDPIASKTEEELKAAADRAAKGAEMQMSQVIAIMSDTSLCMSDMAEFEARHAGAVRQWSARNRELVQRYDKDEAAQARAVGRIGAERARLGGDQARIRQHCERFVASLGPIPAPAPGAPIPASRK